MAIFNETMVGGINAKDCTADASKILNGYTAAVGKEIITGTMPDNGNVDSAIANGVLKEGYTSGGAIANLSEENIKQGVTICGKTGTCKPMPSEITMRVNGIRPAYNPVLLGDVLLMDTYSKKADGVVGGVHRMDENFIWTNPYQYTTTRNIVGLNDGRTAMLRNRDGNDGTTSFAYSIDAGITWSSCSLPVSLYRPPLLYSNGETFVIEGNNSSSSSSTHYVLLSKNGKDWTYFTGALKYETYNGFDGKFYGGTIEKIVGSDAEDFYLYLYTSSDLKTWDILYSKILIRNKSITSATYDYTFKGVYKYGNIFMVFYDEYYRSSSGSVRSDSLMYKYTTNNGKSWSNGYTVPTSSDTSSMEDIEVFDFKDAIYVHPYSSDKVHKITSSGVTTISVSAGSDNPLVIGATKSKIVLAFNNIVDVVDSL